MAMREGKVVKNGRYYNLANRQLTFTCSKSTIETLEKCVKYAES